MDERSSANGQAGPLEAGATAEQGATPALVGHEEPTPPLSPGVPAGAADPMEVEVPGHEVLAELGRGGMGVVYKARHLALGRVVALKMILAGEHAGTQERSRFRGEAEAVARLRHPNIVQIFEVGEAKGHPYFSLEFAEGGSLAGRLGGTPLPPADAAGLIQTLAGAVAHAHQAGIVHRDLKPANILLTADGTPRITDFGLARKLDEAGQTQTGAILGTPSYMAPEQAQGKKEIGPAVDVYALGAILYECLTGRPPFRGPSAFDTLCQVLEAEPVPPRSLQPGVPRDLETVCLKCLQKEPARRYAGARELADDLGRFLRHEPVRARPAGPLYRLGKFVQRHKAAVAGSVVVLLALLAGVVGVGLGWLEARSKREQVRLAEVDAERTRTAARAASLHDQARLDMRRGDWRAALEHIDAALAVRAPDSPSVYLDRVRALCALHEIPRAEAEVDALARRNDLDEIRPQVLLWQADLALNRSPLALAPLKQVRQALDRGLPRAEAAYARALLAETSPKALDHLRQARREDLYNPRSNGMLALLLVALGKHAEAREVLDVGDMLFPEDPTFPIIRALSLALQGDRAGARARVEKLRRKLRPGQLKYAQNLIDLYARLAELGRNVDPILILDAGGSLVGTALRFGWAVARVRAAEKDPEGGLFLPLPPVLGRAFQEMPDLLSMAGFGKGLAAKLERVTKIHPDGILYLARALLTVRKDPATWAAAQPVFLEAARAPSLFDIRRGALVGAIAAESALSHHGSSDARRARKLQALEHTRELLAIGPRVEHMDFLVTVALAQEDVPLARQIVEQWERKNPRDPKLPRQRLLVAFQARRYARFLELLDELVRREPRKAKEWQKQRQEALAGLRQQLEQFEKQRPGQARPGSVE